MKLFEPLCCLWFLIWSSLLSVISSYGSLQRRNNSFLPIAWQTHIQDCSQRRGGKVHFLNDVHFRIHTVRTWTTLVCLFVCLVYFVFKVNRVSVLFYSFFSVSLCPPLFYISVSSVFSIDLSFLTKSTVPVITHQ